MPVCLPTYLHTYPSNPLPRDAVHHLPVLSATTFFDAEEDHCHPPAILPHASPQPALANELRLVAPLSFLHPSSSRRRSYSFPPPPVLPPSFTASAGLCPYFFPRPKPELSLPVGTNKAQTFLEFPDLGAIISPVAAFTSTVSRSIEPWRLKLHCGHLPEVSSLRIRRLGTCPLSRRPSPLQSTHSIWQCNYLSSPTPAPRGTYAGTVQPLTIYIILGRPLAPIPIPRPSLSGLTGL